MTPAKKIRQSVARRETLIEDAVMANPDALGFPRALAIRNCRVSMRTGRVDVLLLPRDGPVRLVLVEAKAAMAHDAASKVVGQLLMYYAGALEFGVEGVRALCEFANKYPERAHSTSWVSPKMLTGGMSPPLKAFMALNRGRRLTPNQIRLFVALDGVAHRAHEPTLGVLHQQHKLHIGLILVRGGKVARVTGPDE